MLHFPFGLLFLVDIFSHSAAGGKHTQVKWHRNSREKTSVRKYEKGSGRERKDAWQKNRRRCHSFSPSAKQRWMKREEHCGETPPISHWIWLIWRLPVKLSHQSWCLAAVKVNIIWKCLILLLFSSSLLCWPVCVPSVVPVRFLSCLSFDFDQKLVSSVAF